MKKTKKIKLETISESAKKRKDFLVIAGIIMILTFIAVSIGMAFLSSDTKKVYKKRKEAVINKKELELIPEKDFKENWAISVENNLKKQNELLLDFMKKTSSDLNSTKVELKNMIIDSTAAQKELIEQNALETDKKIKELKGYLEDRLEKQNNRIEEISIMKGSTINVNSSNKDNDIELGSDLLPPLPKIEKNINNESSTNNTDQTIDAIINGATGINNSTGNNKITKETAKKKSKIIKHKPVKLVDIDTESNKEQIKREAKLIAKMKKKKEKNRRFHVMIGLSRAYMITGAYAPAFSAGEEEPLPVLLQAEGDILIANNDIANVDRCLLIGSAKGNMNSKTADIRLVKISCSLNGGKQMIEGPISGWVIGENGIPGVPGELLHKNGAWLSQTFVAGFMQTFANAFQNSGTTQIAFGATNGKQVPVGEAVSDNTKSALGGGLSTVFGKLGNYYIKMAEQIFPVIEVKAGRTVNILLKGGEDLEVKDLHKVDIPQIEEEFQEDETPYEDLDSDLADSSEFEVDNLSKNVYTNKKEESGSKTDSSSILITE